MLVEAPDPTPSAVDFLEVLPFGTEPVEDLVLGVMTIESDSDSWELSYVNEYMTLEKEGERLASFPDLMTTFNEAGDPVTSAALEEGQVIYLVNVPKENIPVGNGNRYPEIYEPIEAVLSKPMVKYLGNYLIP